MIKEKIIYVLNNENAGPNVEHLMGIIISASCALLIGFLFAETGNIKIFQTTDDEEMDAFLFSLGCYSGEPITVVFHLKGGCIVSIKDGRYTIDTHLAEAICV